MKQPPQPPNRKPPQGRGPLPEWQPPRDPNAGRGQPARGAQPARPAAHKPAAPPPQPQKPKGPPMSHFACPSCGRPFTMPGKAAGRKARCPCGARVLIPPPGGVPRALWMPDEEVRKVHQQKVREGGEKNASEIALETSPAKVAMYVGVLLAIGIGFFVWKKSNESAGPPELGRPPESADDGPSVTKDLTAAELSQKYGASVATIEAVDDAGVPVGHGCGFIAASGRIATTFNLVLGASGLRTKLPDGNILQAAGLAWFDAGSDIAVATLDMGELPVAPLGDSDKVAAGEKVYILGPKMGFENDVREARIERIPAGAGQPAKLSGGVGGANAGGPVFSLGGLVIGVALLLPDGSSAMAPVNPLKAGLEEAKTRSFSEVTAAAAQRPAADILRDAERLLAGGRGRVAVQLLERAIARDSGSPAMLLALGEALLADDRPRAARRRYEEAMKSESGWAARSGIGQARLATGDTGPALAALRSALAAGAGEDPATLAALGLALARLGDAPKAAEAAGKALSLGTGHPRALRMAALACATSRDEDGTRRALAALQKLSPDESSLLLLRGELALASGDAAKAQELFEKAKEAGQGARALVGKGRALAALGQADAALMAWNEAIGARGAGEEAYWVLATGSEAAGKPEEAAAQYRNLLVGDPADADANAGLGRVLFAGDPAKALVHLKQAVEARPEGREYVFEYARACVKAGEVPAAVKALEDFVARRGDDAEARVELAVLKAPDVPEESLKLVEGLPLVGALAGRAAFARGLALFELDRSADARAAFDLAVSFDPLVGDYRYYRALAAEGENVNEALALWESFLAWAKKTGDNPERIGAVVTRLRERYGR
ncbi:MAG: tetratricopeptide repeat protein [Planctomycetes bacterium]|nr:tetratricopeptide repeat protein [Planctomycetota bacterium]